MEHRYRFSVIVPHFDQSIPDDVFCRGIQCLLDQTYKNFEVLIYHDGPVSRPIPEIYKQLNNVELIITPVRENNWGHGNRDKGIRKASGEYIIHFNPDNILYNNALEEINKIIEKSFKEYPSLIFDKKLNKSIGLCNSDKDFDFSRIKLIGTNNIVIFPIYMKGHLRYGIRALYSVRDKSLINHKHIFTGDPAIRYNIDCIQLVMKKELWMEHGGWYDKSAESDGIMYEKFVNIYGARYCDKILGEHR
jgi:glycosyltransferase involved in cell wall biosynthesis